MNFKLKSVGTIFGFVFVFMEKFFLNKFVVKMILYNVMEPWKRGFMEPQNHGFMEPQNHGTMDSWKRGFMEPQNHGTMYSWKRGFMEPQNRVYMIL